MKLKEENIKQLIIGSFVLVIIGGIWYIARDYKETGWISAGIIVMAIIGFLVNQFINKD